MPYRHQVKAGNRADVWKHFILLRVIEHLTRDTRHARFHFMETHAGPGLYTLPESGEWQQGMEQLAGTPYLTGQGNGVTGEREYAGSWLQVYRHLHDRGHPVTLSLCELDPAMHTQLAHTAATHAQHANLQLYNTDGFRLLAESPPADLSFIDPVYAPHGQGDWQAAMAAIDQLRTRQQPGLLWYPLFENATTARQLECHASRLHWECHWGQPGSLGMWGCGMLGVRLPVSLLAPLTTELSVLAGRIGGSLHLPCP